MSYKKKVAEIVVSVMLAFLVMVASADVKSSKIGEYTFFYSELADGTLCIENSAAFRDAKDKKKAPVAVMPKPVGIFEIPATINGKTVSAIGPAALFLSPVEEVILPGTIKSVGTGAFSHCFKLERIRLPKSCVNIGDGAFYGCTALESMQIPLGVSHVGESTFVMCESLMSIDIPVSVTNIGYMAFMGCKSLKELRLPPKLSYLGGGSFSLCTSLVDVKIPASVEKLEPCIFQGCSNLVSVTIQRKYESPAGSFRNCPRLENVHGLNKFEEIDIDDFEGSKLETGLSPNKEGLLLLDGWVFGFAPNETGEYVISAGLRPINSVFIKLPQPSNVYIDGSCPYVHRLYVLDNMTFKGTFENCTNLVSLTIEKSAKKEYDGTSAFSCIGAFRNCKNLKSVVVKDGVRSMSGEVFAGCDSLEYFTLPSMPMTPYRLWGTAIPKNFRIKLYNESLGNAQVACMYINETIGDAIVHNGRLDGEKILEALTNITGFMAKHPDKRAANMQYCLEVFSDVCFSLSAINTAEAKSISPSKQEVRTYQRAMYRALANIYHDAYACAEMGEMEESDGNVTGAVAYYKMAAFAYAEKEIVALKKRGKGEMVDPLVSARECMVGQIDKIRKLGFERTAELLLAELDAKIESGGALDKTQKAVTGTGWAVSPSHIVTCWHVVKDAKELSCVFSDGSMAALSLVAADKANDIAILKIVGSRELSDFLPLRIKPLKISEPVFTIGYPLASILGQSQKYTEGTVSAVSGIDNDVRFYQISTPIQPGNSGGALVNSSGEVVGITSSGLDALMAVGVTGAIPQNVNYAVKARYVAAVLDDNDIQYRTESPKGTSKEKAISRVEKATVLIKAE